MKQLINVWPCPLSITVTAFVANICSSYYNEVINGAKLTNWVLQENYLWDKPYHLGIKMKQSMQPSFPSWFYRKTITGVNLIIWVLQLSNQWGQTLSSICYRWGNQWGKTYHLGIIENQSQSMGHTFPSGYYSATINETKLTTWVLQCSKQWDKTYHLGITVQQSMR